MSTYEKVKSIVAEKLGCDEAEVTLTASLSEDLGADSLDAVELIMTFEEDFGISIPTEKTEELNTIEDIVKLIDSLA